MKSLNCLLLVLILVTSCSGPSENTADNQISPDSLNQVLYSQVMEVHDEIMPNMEVIYKLKQDIEEHIANTPNRTRANEQQLEQIITNLDSANNSMLTWMQNFNPLSDSVEVLKARTYLESELVRVKEVRILINERIAQAQVKLEEELAINAKKTSKSTAKSGKNPQPIPIEVEPKLPLKELTEELIVYEPILREIPKLDSVISKPIAIVDSSTKKKVVMPIEARPQGKPFYFKLINSDSGNPVTGEVHVLEAKATQYQAFKGNELIYLEPPKNIAGIYQATIQAPGYKPAKLVFNYKDPTVISSGIGEKQEVIVTFELIPSKKGDYIDFNEVRFFRNTTILEPQSHNELKGLVNLMKEGSFKVRIHGHCNGDDSRDVITLGSSTNIFALDPTHNRRESLTAKRLTELRAEVVRNYMISQGIADDRITTKGQGGKMMIYPRTSTLANRNDRVEVEVLKSK